MLIATFSDRIRHRFAFILGSLAVAITGVIVLLTVYDKERIHIQYLALILVISGRMVLGKLSFLGLQITWAAITAAASEAPTKSASGTSPESSPPLHSLPLINLDTSAGIAYYLLL